MIEESLRSGAWLTDLRVRRIAICAAIVISLGFALEIWLHLHLVPKRFSHQPVNFPVGEDFSNFWSGSALALQGKAASVFDPSAFQAFEHSHLPPFLQFRWYAYPPMALLLTLPLALLPYLAAYAAWLAAGAALCALLLRRHLPWPMAIAAAVFTPASFINAVAGQNGAFSAAIIAGALLLLTEHPLIAGLLISLLSFKPHLALLFPVALIAARRWDAFVAAALGCVLLAAASMAAFGSDIWRHYLDVAPLNRPIMELGRLPEIVPTPAKLVITAFWNRMPTIFAAARELGGGIGLSYALQLISAVLAAASVWHGWRRTSDPELRGAIFIFAALAATPYAWDYDLIMLTFAAVWLWTRGKREGFLPYEKSAIALLFASTMIGAAVIRLLHIPMAQIAIWLALCLALRRVTKAQTVATPEPLPA